MDNLGPYQLESVLGRGGMGTVYRAIDRESQETMAVKVLAPVYSHDDHFRNRFESEITALLKLDHPNIVRLISYGQDDQNLYFAMELVEGRSLFQLQRDKMQFDWREVIRIAKNVALGLRHAHDRGVIHRDLKPGNLLKAETGIVKITDFGIAKNFGQSQNTGTNVLGTVDFMSPEQAKGQPVTFRSDLYSLGTVMFTLLTGRAPFTSNSVEESMRNLTQVPAPRVARQAPDVPPELDQLIAQLLEKNPEKRIPTALSLYHQLKQVEMKLRESSQAMTAERERVEPADAGLELDAPVTDVDPQRVSAQTVMDEHGKKRHADAAGSAPNFSRQSTKVDSIHGPRGPVLKKAEDDKHDFFNSVTDDERQEFLESQPDEGVRHSVWSKVALATLLLTVLITAAYGIVAANRTPSAKDLLAQIDELPGQPQRHLSQIATFIECYPEHDRYESVVAMKALAMANQTIGQLRARRRLPGALTEVEREFLTIVDSLDRSKAAKQLATFIALRQSSTQNDGWDAECLAAAHSYLDRLTYEGKQQEQTVIGKIKQQLATASESEPQQAREIYEYIIENNRQFDWAEEWVQKARKNLAQTKAVKGE